MRSTLIPLFAALLATTVVATDATAAGRASRSATWTRISNPFLAPLSTRLANDRLGFPVLATDTAVTPPLAAPSSLAAPTQTATAPAAPLEPITSVSESVTAEFTPLSVTTRPTYRPRVRSPFRPPPRPPF
ncbi:hypothetical protein Pla108_32530 [Botrimarina colliarenosi]|uniref:Uncharacterized protein n=1 Tax=Botrimarina colliarenosi TaxID=2528001 RepID=A0A5C6A9P6_9BACT|nr:hypothetical protein Pla108_32530 [Botrimarina colliarenosi]